LRTSAVWSADADRIIFYDSTGTRFHVAELAESPPQIEEIEEIAA
jgi:hypothetical protein